MFAPVMFPATDIDPPAKILPAALTDPAETEFAVEKLPATTAPDALSPIEVMFPEFNKFPVATLAATILPVVILAEYKVPDAVNPPTVTVPVTDNASANTVTPVILAALMMLPAKLTAPVTERLPPTVTLPVAVMFVAW